MKFKKLLIHFIIVCVTCTNFFYNIYAEPLSSGSAIEDEEQETVETTTEITTAAPVPITGDAPGGAPSFNITAEACVLMDANSGIVLFGKNPDEKLYPASITKIMTALLAVEYGHFDDVITVSGETLNTVPWDSSNMGLIEGEQLTFENLIYGLMLKSGNDAAAVIAETVAGSQSNFAEMMNEKALEVGAKNTHFVNPHGYQDPNHYTTAYDMSLIAKEAVKNQEFNNIWSTEEREVAATNKSERRLMYNTDKMLHKEYTNYYYENLVGGKTGFHNDAMNTLVSYATMGDVKLICVVLKEPSYDASYIDTKNMFNYGFGLYKNTKLFSSSSFTAQVPVIQHYKDRTIDLGTVAVSASGDYSAIVPNFINENSIEAVPQLADSIEAPVIQGDVVGTLTLKYKDNVIGTMDITADKAVAAIPQNELIRDEKADAFKNNLTRVLTVIAGAVVTIILFIFLLKLWFSGRKPKRRKRNSYYVGNMRSSQGSSAKKERRKPVENKNTGNKERKPSPSKNKKKKTKIKIKL